MDALLSLLYGLAAYAASLATLLYLVGFTGNLLVPKSVDLGSPPWPGGVLTNLLLVALFAVQHSVMARRGFKRWWLRIVPAAVERSTYVLATCAVLGLWFWAWTPLPFPVVWRMDGLPAAVLWGLFATGWLLALVSTFLIHHFELFGLQQVWSRFTGRPRAEMPFSTPLLYRHVRHPLYLGLLLAFWATPVMTAGHLLYALAATAYVFIGVAFEERDLLVQFGERYRAYRADVGMLLPRPRWTKRHDNLRAGDPHAD